MTTYLSTNFTLEEFTDSQTAARQGITNDPPIDVYSNLKSLAYAMEEVRTVLGNRPILVSSAYRCPELNRAVGGSKYSQHVLGEAVDFTCPSFGTPAQIVTALVESDIQFDQVILEFQRWCHISFSSRNRRQALVIDAAGTRSFA